MRPTCAGVRGLVASVAVLSVNCCDELALTFTSPAMTTTAAEPSGQRDTTEASSAATSADCTVWPLGTVPGSG